jgi:6-hydroxynicotinate 3-monooxygenase
MPGNLGMAITKGRIAVVGAGPGGMAAALAALRLGFDVTLFERATQIRAAGNILNLWPPPQKILKLIGADGINSFVRRYLWGDEPIRHQHLHLVGGYLFVDAAPEGIGIIAHNLTTQVSYTPIRHEGKWGYEWWVLEACDPAGGPPPDLVAFCRERARGFPPTVQKLIAATPLEHMQRWEIRDRPPLAKWSRGRVALVGDAAHPTSPYAAYGAGMSIEDGYFPARELDCVDLADTVAVRAALERVERRRIPHTVSITQGAYYAGKLFHHCPAVLRPLRDLLFDHTPLLQKIVGDAMPAHILSQLAQIEDAAPHVPVHKRDGRSG